MQNNTDNIDNYDAEIDLKELFLILWNKKILISFITTIAAILSLLYALSLPNIYSSHALLAPSNPNESLTSKLGAYSALAGMAGVSIPGTTSDPSLEAIERIKSFDFFSNHFLPYIKLENLVAVEEWVPGKNTLLYDEEAFDSNNGMWIRKVEYPLSIIPSNQEAYRVYREILSISLDQKNQFVSVSISHKSPFLTKKWLDIIIKNINESMREIDKQSALNSINFLNESSQVTNLIEIKEVLAQLLEGQMQKLMLASANKNYIYKEIESPVAPETKSSPSRGMICILGTILGGIFGILLAFVSHYSSGTQIFTYRKKPVI
tara:strand:+ start:347 stop:1306 length:960 start_codon:yes stop_codon:yes gene_type:complete